MPYLYSWTPSRVKPTSASQVRVYDLKGAPAVFTEPIAISQGKITLSLRDAGEYIIRVRGTFETEVDAFLVSDTPPSSSTSGLFPLQGQDTILTPVETGKYGINIVDPVQSAGIASHIDHYGAGIGFDIRNRPGAGMGMVLHQYSNSTGVRLDNTGTGPMLVIAQTHNEVLNPNSLPNTSASGDAFRQVDYLGNIWFKLDSRGAIVLTPPVDQTSETLRIIGNATSTKNSARITHNAASHGVLIEQGAGAAGFYSLVVTGQSYGASIASSTNSGQALTVTKNGTGAGETLRLVNKGTGATLQINKDTTPVARVTVDGEFEHLTSGKGLLLKSPNGTRYRVSVTDAGAISVVAAP